ncbi:MAG TPA: sugar transferase [Gammaproteobacteria bacterium]|nr:sugar transferase [Gammaproteobacteria bacterium]
MFKRIFDFSLASILLILLAPLFLLLYCLVRFYLGQPVFFKQKRPGLHEKPFYLLKFRTMLNQFDQEGQALPDEKRLTPFGSLLRSLSLDELPELLNILKGEMSFVGPRPLLMEYLPYYSPEQKQRHSLKPGMTGWAQINGRNTLSWKEKFELDLFYVNHYSFVFDCKIIFLTLIKIIKREGIHALGQATMTRFDLEEEKHRATLSDFKT